jgi:hypothetical protein
MDRRDFVRASGATVALVTGCVGGDSPDGDDGETNATDGEGNGSDGGSNQTETEGEDSGADGQEETGEEGEPGYEEAGYTRFMYDPEQAGVDADGYVFKYTSAGASQGLAERVVGASDSAGNIAIVEVRDTGEGSERGGIFDEAGREIVEVRAYEQVSSFEESVGSLTEPVDSRAGYDIYESDESVSGVSDDSLTVIEGPTVDRVRLVAETLEDETSSYVESNDDMRLLTDAVGTGNAVRVRGQPPGPDALASAVSFSEDGGAVNIRYAAVYPGEEEANAAISPESVDLESTNESEEPPEVTGVTPDKLTPLFVLAVTDVGLSPGDPDLYDQTADGRVAVVEASVESDALFEGAISR